MSRIPDIFKRLREQGRTGIMPFICAGYPPPPAGPSTADLIRALDQAGADIIEVGIPFSDPIADGPVIAKAMHEALQHGTTPDTIIRDVESVRADVDAGLVAMVTISIVRRIGVDAFLDRIVAAGFDGIIVPDLPIEEEGGLAAQCTRRGLTCSFLIAPSTPDERAARIARTCTGFIYLLARAGITGERTDAPEIGQSVSRLRARTDLPIACGFGLSTGDHVRAVGQHADAAIVGSALVRAMGAAVAAGKDPGAAAADLVRELRAGTVASR